MSERRKVTVVGAGNVGATCAQVLAQRDYADIVLVDIKEGLPRRRRSTSTRWAQFSDTNKASLEFERLRRYCRRSEVVVVAAGLPRSPGMSRGDLVQTNEKIVKDVT